MGRLVVWLLVILLLAGGVRYAVTTRYEYLQDGTTQTRKDRWTGEMQVWGCAAYEVRGTESAYFPLASDTNQQCTRHGWIQRK